jgi:hypothetical protein
MSNAVALLFGLSFLLSGYAVLLTLAQKWPRIEAVMAMQGTASERIIRVGQVRHTGQRLRLVVANEPDAATEQRMFNFVALRAA